MRKKKSLHKNDLESLIIIIRLSFMIELICYEQNQVEFQSILLHCPLCLEQVQVSSSWVWQAVIPFQSILSFNYPISLETSQKKHPLLQEQIISLFAQEMKTAIVCLLVLIECILNTGGPTQLDTDGINSDSL